MLFRSERETGRERERERDRQMGETEGDRRERCVLACLCVCVFVCVSCVRACLHTTQTHAVSTGCVDIRGGRQWLSSSVDSKHRFLWKTLHILERHTVFQREEGLVWLCSGPMCSDLLRSYSQKPFPGREIQPLLSVVGSGKCLSIVHLISCHIIKCCRR